MPCAAGGIPEGGVDPRIVMPLVVAEDSEQGWQGEGHDERDEG